MKYSVIFTTDPCALNVKYAAIPTGEAVAKGRRIHLSRVERRGLRQPVGALSSWWIHAPSNRPRATHRTHEPMAHVSGLWPIPRRCM